MTKNRLAAVPMHAMANKERSHTVNQTNRKKVVGNKTFYKLGASSREQTSQSVARKREPHGVADSAEMLQN